MTNFGSDEVSLGNDVGNDGEYGAVNVGELFEESTGGNIFEDVKTNPFE